MRHAQLTRQEQQKYTQDAQRTMLGTLMLGRLQEAVDGSKLKDTAPDVQRKLIRAEVEGKGFETAYIDTETAIKKDNGLDDLKKVAKTAGVSDEDLETAIAQKGHLTVPVEVYAQSKASPELLESVSFSVDTDSMARMKESAKEIREAMEAAHEEAAKQQIDIMDAALGEWFPEAAKNMDEAAKHRMEQDREWASAAIITRMDNPMQGWNELYKKAVEEREAILQPALDALARGMKQGVDIIQGEEGRGVRVSNNEAWYRDFYKEYGRAPTQTELRDMARAMVAGEATAPKVEGWWMTDLTESDIEELDRMRTEMDRLDENIETLERIKDRMKELDGVELKLTAGLTAEGYSVYRRVMADLKSIGGRASKAARMNAVLLARHADLYAKVVAEKTGRKFTALDYYHTFMVQAGREGDVTGGLNQSTAARRLKEDMREWKEKVDDYYKGTLPHRNNVMMRSPLVFELIGADSTLPIAIDASILEKLVTKHHFTREQLRQLPKKIADPLFVLRAIDSKTQIEDKKKRIVVIDMEINGATVMIPFVLNTIKDFNKIASAYGRTKDVKKGNAVVALPNDNWYMNRLNNKNLLYINIKRTNRWVNSKQGLTGRHNAPLTVQSFKPSIPNETDLGKLKRENRGFYHVGLQ